MTIDRRPPDRADEPRLFGDLLIEGGLISRADLSAGLNEQQLRGGRLGYTLLRIGRVTPAALYLFLQDHLPVFQPDLVEALRASPAVDLIPAPMARHYGMMPIRVRDGVLDLAVASADTPRLIPAVEELTGLRVDPLICPPSLIAGALARSYPAEVEAGIIHPQAGDCLFILSDRRRGLRPMLPETVREDAPPSEWLRSIAAEGIRRAARRIRIEPWAAGMRVEFHGPLGDAEDLDLPRGAYPGLSCLLAGLSGIAARGRVVPREGRLILIVEKRRIRASVMAIPGPEGDLLTLDLRDERILPAPADDRALDLSELPRYIDRMVAGASGLVLVAAPGAGEIDAALAAVLDLVGERLPRRIGLGDRPQGPFLEMLEAQVDEESIPLAVRLQAALARRPDLLVTPDLAGEAAIVDALALAGERVIVAPVQAPDAFQAAERMARAGIMKTIPASLPAGIVAARLMEQLCGACARPFDLHELLAPWPGHRAPVSGSYFAGQGCNACRGSGVVRLEPVFEFLPIVPGESFPGGAVARGRSLSSVGRDRRAAAGKSTLFRAALRRAAAGRLDVREPLRLLLHELD